jgi:hypothetical protein
MRNAHRFDAHCGKAFTALLNHAQQQYGYLTPDDTRELGIDPTQLRLMAARHTLERKVRPSEAACSRK